MSHFLQTKAWQGFQESLGRETYFRSGKGWSYLAILETGKGSRRLYCPYGPTVTSITTLREAVADLKILGKKLDVMMVRVEPIHRFSRENLEKLGLKKVNYIHLQPQDTRIVNLEKSEEDIIADMNQNCRNRYRNYEKRGMKYVKTYDSKYIDHLITLLDAVAKRTGIKTHSADYFRLQAEELLKNHDASIHMMTLNGKPIAVSLAYDDKTTRYYAHAAADGEYRKLQAGTILVASMIIDAKREGKQSFDLYGIAPNNNPKHPWAGFSSFKKAFGGEVVHYSGLWELAFKKRQYWLYRFVMLILSLRKRL